MAAWIDGGAGYAVAAQAEALPAPPDHWSFRKPVRPAVPVVAEARNPIDAFVAVEREKHKLTACAVERSHSRNQTGDWKTRSAVARLTEQTNAKDQDHFRGELAPELHPSGTQSIRDAFVPQVKTEVSNFKRFRKLIDRLNALNSG